MRILITGANRGIGLDLTRRYLARGETVFATCRQPDKATDLQTLAQQHPGKLHILCLDVTDNGAIADSLTQVQSKTDALDMLINNAGSFAGSVDDADPRVRKFGALEAKPMLEMLHVNSVAPVILAQALTDLLCRGENARLVNMSSDAGSITNRKLGGNYSYGASKTALNMFTRCLAGSLRGAGVTVICLHPGWIQTDMGGPRANYTLDDTMPGVIHLLDNLTLDDSGGFFNWDGALIPW